MSISAVAAGTSQAIQASARPQTQPVAQVNVPRADTDQVQISSAAKQLHAKATHSDRDHDGD